MRLLVLTRHCPLPGWDGAGSYLFSLLSYFARQGVTIEVAWSEPPLEWIRQRPLRLPESLDGVCSLQLPGSLALGRWRWTRWGSHKARALHCLRRGLGGGATPGAGGGTSSDGRSGCWHRLPSAGELQFFRERIRFFKPDAVLANYCWLTPALEHAAGCRTAVLANDVVSQRLAQLDPAAAAGEQPLNPARPEGERALLAKAQVILAITEEDAATFRAWLPERTTVLTPMAASLQPSAGHREIPGRCLFVGGVNEPNREALAWLLGEIWPRIRDRRPAATLHIFGQIAATVRHPPAGVTLRGRVDSLAEAYAESQVALVPLRLGSGMKIKLVEAASQARPCVTTTVGLHGLAALRPHVVVADEAEMFAAETCRLLEDSSLARNLGLSLQKTAASVLSAKGSFGPALNVLFPGPAEKSRRPVAAAPGPAGPAVSVILPVYNAARYLRPALTSILAQTWRDFELIAIDDGSADESLAILKEFAARDGRIAVHHRPNTGIVGALNDGLARARGEFIARMDADDEAAPTRLAVQVARLRAEPDLVALGSAVILMDDAGHSVKALPRPTEHGTIERALLAGDGGAMIHPAVTFRARAVAAVGGYRPEAGFVEDLDLFLRLARIGTLANLPTPELRYRVHPLSINFTKNNGRHAVKLAVLRDAWTARGLDFDPAAIAESFTRYADQAVHHREWAVTSLAFGARGVAVGHGWQTVRLRPFESASWRALRYALTAPLPRINPCPPS